MRWLNPSMKWLKNIRKGNGKVWVGQGATNLLREGDLEEQCPPHPERFQVKIKSCCLYVLWCLRRWWFGKAIGLNRRRRRRWWLTKMPESTTVSFSDRCGTRELYTWRLAAPCKKKNEPSDTKISSRASPIQSTKSTIGRVHVSTSEKSPSCRQSSWQNDQYRQERRYNKMISIALVATLWIESGV